MMAPTRRWLFVLAPVVLVALPLGLVLMVLPRPPLGPLTPMQPNARRSQRTPRPQGGGIAVVAGLPWQLSAGRT